MPGREQPSHHVPGMLGVHVHRSVSGPAEVARLVGAVADAAELTVLPGDGATARAELHTAADRGSAAAGGGCAGRAGRRPRGVPPCGCRCRPARSRRLLTRTRRVGYSGLVDQSSICRVREGSVPPGPTFACGEDRWAESALPRPVGAPSPPARASPSPHGAKQAVGAGPCVQVPECDPSPVPRRGTVRRLSTSWGRHHSSLRLLRSCTPWRSARRIPGTARSRAVRAQSSSVAAAYSSVQGES